MIKSIKEYNSKKNSSVSYDFNHFFENIENMNQESNHSIKTYEKRKQRILRLKSESKLKMR